MDISQSDSMYPYKSEFTVILKIKAQRYSPSYKIADYSKIFYVRVFKYKTWRRKINYLLKR